MVSCADHRSLSVKILIDLYGDEVKKEKGVLDTRSTKHFAMEFIGSLAEIWV